MATTLCVNNIKLQCTHQLDNIEAQFTQQIGHEPHTVQQMLNFCRHNNFGLKYKDINQWWLKRAEPKPVRPLNVQQQYNTDSNRETWKINTWLLIFSRSKDEWFPGKIEQVIDNWFVVKYGKTTKKIQRNSNNLQPFPLNHRSLWKIGSKCKIYSPKIHLWCNGEIIDIYYDSEGEWLKIKYNQSNIEKICEIQRFSKDIISNHDLDGICDDNIQSIDVCSTENIIYYLRNYVYIEPQFKSKKFLKYKEKIVAFFFQNQINGIKIQKMEKTQFVEKLCKYLDVKNINNKKLKNSFRKIFDLLTVKMNEMFVELCEVNSETFMEVQVETNQKSDDKDDKVHVDVDINEDDKKYDENKEDYENINDEPTAHHFSSRRFFVYF